MNLRSNLLLNDANGVQEVLHIVRAFVCEKYDPIDPGV